MNKELEVLEHIAKDNNITQRKIAERTGLSLGAANILIKRFIKKGFVKVEQVNSRTLRYLLTQKGIGEKTKLKYAYIVYSYSYITGLNNRIKEIVSNRTDLEVVYLYGDNDEVCDIIANSLNKMSIKSKMLNNDELTILSTEKFYIIIVWDIERSQYLNEKGIKSINILEL